ncbi:hypothetical protein BC834DRAFT_542948 [Gloeopeniophorella convolvens]|nr:hypothetical protein BC834DRAFT_542948 [Gloeopeniophorella convolvens]
MGAESKAATDSPIPNAVAVASGKSTANDPQPAAELPKHDKESRGTNTEIKSNGVALPVAAAQLEAGPDSTPNNTTSTPNSKAEIPNSTVVPSAAGQPPVDDPKVQTKEAERVPSIVADDSSGQDDGTPASPSTPTASSQNPLASAEPLTSSALDTSKSPLDALKSSRNSMRNSRDSLTSSRPAPPSPAASRRASAALSRHSSTRSRPTSMASSVLVATPDTETNPMTPTPAVAQAQAQPRRTSILVRIRDFAFPSSDARHTGTGPLTPHPNRRLQRPLSTWSASSASSTGSDRDDSGSFGFGGWGSLGRLSWFGGRGSGGSADTDAPSAGDFARNFTDAMSPENEANDPYESLGESDEDEDWAEERVDEDAAGERPLLPGLYRALYAFEPEGTAEMALEEDQMVRVVGRGGGVGWAIVVREGSEGHALVPEGYLEPVSLDQDQEGDEER